MENTTTPKTTNQPNIPAANPAPRKTFGLESLTPKINTITPTKPLPLPQLTPKTEIEVFKTPKKKNIFLLFILSIITIDTYTAIWYMAKSLEFPSLGTKKKPSQTIPLLLLISNILLITSILIFPLTIDIEEMGGFYQHLSTLQISILSAIIFFALIKLLMTLTSAFHARSIINQALENKESKAKVSVFFTLIFTHLYLQYEINKIMDDKEENPKTGPVMFFLVILLLIIAGALYYFL